MVGSEGEESGGVGGLFLAHVWWDNRLRQRSGPSNPNTPDYRCSGSLIESLHVYFLRTVPSGSVYTRRILASLMSISNVMIDNVSDSTFTTNNERIIQNMVWFCSGKNRQSSTYYDEMKWKMFIFMRRSWDFKPLLHLT